MGICDLVKSKDKESQFLGVCMFLTDLELEVPESLEQFYWNWIRHKYDIKESSLNEELKEIYYCISTNIILPRIFRTQADTALTFGNHSHGEGILGAITVS